MAENKTGGKEGFTLGLALLDAVPVVAFGVDMMLLSKPLGSKIFLLGAFLALCGGLCMVIYKIILSVFQKDYPVCKKMFPIFMGGGWLIMIVAAIMARKNIHLAGIWKAICTMPATLFFVLGLCFFVAFIVYFKTKFNADSAKDNWVEEILNAGAQVCMMIAVILSV